jgi:hypothetical protein
LIIFATPNLTAKIKIPGSAANSTLSPAPFDLLFIFATPNLTAKIRESNQIRLRPRKSYLPMDYSCAEDNAQ